MTSVNESTGKKMQTGIPTEEYKDNYELIFNHKKVKEFYETKVLPFHPELPEWEMLNTDKQLEVTRSYTRNR